MLFIVIEVLVTFVVCFLIVRAYVYVASISHALCITSIICVSCSILIEISLDVFFAKEIDGSANLQRDTGLYATSGQQPVVLWWTSFGISSAGAVSRECYKKTCVFTSQREVRDTLSHVPKAIAFYGSDLNVADLPFPRKDGELWALLHEESPKNAPHLTSEYFFSLFNFTSTFSRRSHLPLTTLHLQSLDNITDTKFFVSTAEKNKLRNSTAMAPVLYVQSNCDTLTNRDAFVEELSKYVKVDSYGKCLRNSELPQTLTDPITFDSEEFFHFASKYKFTLAIENAVCEDYITEKLWRSLIVGSVPIYFGSPSVRDWLPNYDSAILVSEFNTAQTLAAYIKALDSDDNRYNHYLRHKIDGTISNQFLKKNLKCRRWDGYEDLIQEFECQLCVRLHEFDGEGINTQKVDETHYSCPFPAPISLPIQNNKNGEIVRRQWSTILRSAHCEAKAVFEMASERTLYTQRELDRRSHQLMLNTAC